MAFSSFSLRRLIWPVWSWTARLRDGSSKSGLALGKALQGARPEPPFALLGRRRRPPARPKQNRRVDRDNPDGDGC